MMFGQDNMIMPKSIKWGLFSYALSAYLLAFAVDILASYFIVAYQAALTPIILIWGFVRMYTPTFATIIALKILGKNIILEFSTYFGRIRDHLTLKWYLLSPLITLLSLGIYILISISFGFFSLTTLIDQIKYLQNILPQEISQTTLLILIIFSTIISSYFVGLTLNAAYALGEEIGWRGFLVNLLLNKFGFLRTCAIIGLLWGFWHGTAILFLGHNYQIHRIEGIFLFTIIAVLFTFPHVYVRVVSKSILPAASLHGSINALWGFTIFVTQTSNNEIIGGLGFLGIATWLITASLTVYYGKRRRTLLQ